MQDTYSDCITTTNQCYGYFLTSQDYMDWGRDMRNQKLRIEDQLMHPKASGKEGRKKNQYPRKFVPYVSKTGYVGVWEVHSCPDHKNEASKPYETQPLVKEIFTPRKELPKPKPPAGKPARTTGASRRIRDRESIQQLVMEKSIKLPDIKIHPLASREESSRRGVRKPAQNSFTNTLFETRFQSPWKHSGMIRGL